MRRVFANLDLDSLMSNSKAQPSRVPNDSPSGTEKLHTGIERPDDSVRDFFRRGDRGQYAGGPADHVHSIPTLDLPEKPQIVRTPKQEARRRALIRLEAVLLTGCLGLLVMAARAKSTDATEPSRAGVAQFDARLVEPSAPKAPVAVQPEVQKAARPEAAPPAPKTANEPMLNAQAPVAAAAAEPPPPPPKAANEPALNVQAPEAPAAAELVMAPRVEDAAKSAPAAPEKAASTQTAKRAQPRQASARSVAAAPARPTSAPKAEPVYAPPVAAPAQNPPAPKRAVAAFPVD
jgi:hypothetical protein